ncbi:MAG: dihydrodipicolinate synthase family protein [Candidatus Humimicrobiaceae bacterium]
MHIPKGTVVAMLTPFDNEGKVNEIEVRKMVTFFIAKGVDGIFPVASCGEYTHIDISERKFLIDVVVDEARGRVDIIPGSGSTCYKQSIEMANYAKEKGCAAVVLHGPYFFPNTQEVVEGHLRKVAESVDIPIFLYNIPQFANEVTPAMIERLCSMPNVVGVKESSGNMVNVMNILEMTRKIDPNFRVMLGAEELFLPGLLMGAQGCMTASTGVLPEFVVGIYKSFLDGNFRLSYNLQMDMLPLIREMKTVNFPQGFKEAQSLRGIDMGIPKMNYPPAAMTKIFNLKDRLKLMMASLLNTYFPNEELKFNFDNKINKYKYPEATHELANEKKHTDCTMCGMCNGDRCSNKQEGSELPKNQESLNPNRIFEENQNASNGISRDYLEKLVSEVVKNLINEKF